MRRQRAGVTAAAAVALHIMNAEELKRARWGDPRPASPTVATREGAIGFLDLLFDWPPSGRALAESDANDPRTVVRLTSGVSDLLYNRSYAERCDRDGRAACSAWPHTPLARPGRNTSA